MYISPAVRVVFVVSVEMVNDVRMRGAAGCVRNVLAWCRYVLRDIEKEQK